MQGSLSGGKNLKEDGEMSGQFFLSGGAQNTQKGPGHNIKNNSNAS